MLKILSEGSISVTLVSYLGFEIANHILVYTTGTTYNGEVVHFDCDTKFSAKEK